MAETTRALIARVRDRIGPRIDEGHATKLAVRSVGQLARKRPPGEVGLNGGTQSGGHPTATRAALPAFEVMSL
jgi:hypothetical protein